MPSHLRNGLEDMIPGVDEITDTLNISDISIANVMSDSFSFILIIVAIVGFFLVKKKGALSLKGALIITAIFTALDYIAHIFGILPEVATLPSLYFIFKVLALPIILLTLVNQFKFRNFFAICITSALILQVRYYYTGLYDTTTNIIMMIVHYFLIAGAVFITKKFFKEGI